MLNNEQETDFQLSLDLIDCIFTHFLSYLSSQGIKLTKDKVRELFSKLDDHIAKGGLVLDDNSGTFYRIKELNANTYIMFTKDGYLAEKKIQYDEVVNKGMNLFEFTLNCHMDNPYSIEEFISVYEKEFELYYMWKPYVYNFFVKNIISGNQYNVCIVKILYLTYMAYLGCISIHMLFKEVYPNYKPESIENRMVTSFVIKNIFNSMLNINFKLYTPKDCNAKRIYINNSVIATPKGFPRFRDCYVNDEILELLRFDDYMDNEGE